MASFGETVSSLVDAYTKCLAFLRVSRKTEHPDKLRKASAGSDQASTLQSALRKSRSKVRRTYTSKRSDGGAAFEKGDAAARSSLRRIIRLLTSTLATIQGSFTGHNSNKSNSRLRRGVGVNYASLVSLCESSKSDALQTMTDLSGRLSKSGASTASQRSRRSRASTKSHRDAVTATKRAYHHPHKRPIQTSDTQRLWRISTSSNSTKLGEVRRHRRDNYANAADPSSSRVAYPKRSASSSMLSTGRSDQRKRRWWNVFR